MIRLSMIVKNEERRYLRRVLESARRYITDAVIIDDASTDGTVSLCRDMLDGIPHRIVENSKSKFHNEWELRYQQWTETVGGKPDWILFLDADEVFEDGFAAAADKLTQTDSATGSGCFLYSFRLFDFWDEEHYRDDALWCAHTVYRPFLLKYRDDFRYEFAKTSQHCGRMPSNVFSLPNGLSPYRVKHYGWAREEDRREKYERYMRLDPHGLNGSLAQYLSIMDTEPNLVKWEE